MNGRSILIAVIQILAVIVCNQASGSDRYGVEFQRQLGLICKGVSIKPEPFGLGENHNDEYLNSRFFYS